MQRGDRPLARHYALPARRAKAAPQRRAGLTVTIEPFDALPELARDISACATPAHFKVHPKAICVFAPER